ncbi:MAG: hypothetical protein ACRD0L_03360 [Acidimicrobiales bacterium]
MRSPTQDLAPASLDELRSASDQIKRLATRHGLLHVRATPSGVLVVDVEAGRSYVDLVRFEAEIEDLLERRVEVVPTDVAGRGTPDSALLSAVPL